MDIFSELDLGAVSRSQWLAMLALIIQSFALWFSVRTLLLIRKRGPM